MRGNTKIRVKTAALLEAVRAKKAAQDKTYTKAKDEHPGKVERYRAAVIKELRDAADKIEKGGQVPRDRYGPACLKFKADYPCEPTRDTNIDRTIKTLEMAAEDSISISADDYARYLG